MHAGKYVLGAILLAAFQRVSPCCSAAESHVSERNEIDAASTYKTCIEAADGRGAGPFEDCVIEATRAIDTKLRAALESAMEVQSPALADRIRRSQIVWLAYRKEACGIELAIEGEGHPSGIEAQGYCLLQITQQRIERLKSLSASP